MFEINFNGVYITKSNLTTLIYNKNKYGLKLRN